MNLVFSIAELSLSLRFLFREEKDLLCGALVLRAELSESLGEIGDLGLEGLAGFLRFGEVGAEGGEEVLCVLFGRSSV